jgi:hypothetical protein
MAKESKPIIKKYRGGRYKRFSEKDGAVENKTEFKLQVLPRGMRLQYHYFTHSPTPLPKINVYII